MHEIIIGNITIGKDHPPCIVAEMSGNHNHSLERALQLVDKAAESGCHAIKLQTYTPDTMTLNIKSGPFFIQNPKNPWAGESLYELYEKAATPWEWHAALFDRAKEKGLIAFSTPFDATAVDFLESLAVPCYKIAANEILDHPLIARVAKTKKPLILSTAGATLGEIDDAVRLARQHGCQDLILLRGVNTYPAPVEAMHLRTLPHLASAFQCAVGLSDHSLGIGAAIASIAYGGRLIEKHITLSRSEGGVDSGFSLEPHEFAALTQAVKEAFLAEGKVSYGMQAIEEPSYVHRRSLYFVKEMKAGDIIMSEHIRAIRPGGGLHPKYLKTIMGKIVARHVTVGTPVSWEHVLCE